MKKPFYAIFAIGLLSALSACNKNSDSPAPAPAPIKEVTKDKTAYVTASCEFKPDQGESAPVNLLEPAMTKTYFDKQYDSNLLAAVIKASALETVRIANLSGVAIYKTSKLDREDSCDFMDFLSAPPKDAMDKWDEQTKTRPDDKGKVIGLYLPQDQKANDFQKSQATIMLRKDSSRWVVVHEYMHHLFSKEVQAKMSDADVKAKLTASVDDYEKAAKAVDNEKKSGPEKEALVELKVAKFLDLAGYINELLIRFPLEEMTIETTLREKMLAGELGFAPKNQALNGANYVLSSQEMPTKLLNSILSESNTLIIDGLSLKGELFYALVHLKDSTKAKLTLIENLANQAEEYLKKAKKDNSLASAVLSSGDISEQNQSEESHIGCSHGIDMPEIDFSKFH